MDDLERSVEDEVDWEAAAGEVSEVGQASAMLGDGGWTEEEKALVVRECCWPGVKVGEVARRYGLSANQVNAWRALARRGKLPSPFSEAAEGEAEAERTLAARRAEAEPDMAASRRGPVFAALEVEATAPGAVGSVSIEARGVTVRVDGEIGVVRIAEIASALRGLR